MSKTAVPYDSTDWQCPSCHAWTVPDTIDVDDKGNDLIDLDEICKCQCCENKLKLAPKGLNRTGYKFKLWIKPKEVSAGKV